MQWYKFYGSEFLSDTKIATLNAQERSCWITLLCLASTATNSGTIEFLTVEVLLKKSGIECDPYNPDEWNNALGVLHKFERMKMISMNEDGQIRLINWSKRQESAMTGYERIKKHRQNKAKLKNDNEMITHDNENDNCRIDKNRIEENRIHNTYTSEKSDMFNQFWTAYPKKELKKRTQEVWKRKNLDSKISEIVNFIEKAKITDRWKKGFVKQPPAFLNGECWNDDVSSYNDKKVQKDIFSSANTSKYENLKVNSIQV